MLLFSTRFSGFIRSCWCRRRWVRYRGPLSDRRRSCPFRSCFGTGQWHCLSGHSQRFLFCRPKRIIWRCFRRRFGCVRIFLRRRRGLFWSFWGCFGGSGFRCTMRGGRCRGACSPTLRSGRVISACGVWGRMSSFSRISPSAVFSWARGTPVSLNRSLSVRFFSVISP